MSIFPKINLLTIASFGVLALGLAACGNQAEDTPKTDNSTSSEVSTGEEQPGTRTLTDALGNKVAIPENPKRVLASYLEDPLVALGITPIAQWSLNEGASIQGYLQDYLKDVDLINYDLPFEEVQSFEPDLIIMDSPSMVEGGKYGQYSAIAPTYVIGAEMNNDWREELRTIGGIFAKEDKAEQVIADYETKAGEAKARIEEKIGKKSAAAIWLVGGSFFVVNKELSSGDVLYNDLGFEVPAVVAEISASGENNWNAVSLEKLVELDADYLFLVNSDGSESAALSDSLWQSIPAVKAGNVYEFGADTSWLYTGAIANDQMIDDVLESVAK
ncbi:ABC transporter substrate-binding protein [Ureibacillus sinduriensis]|uniref:ABC transporter substrate-binding protein n=1 Tax=Ureibacillus sinduriensis BLB-1 = JCM 15800 TaxID=1384057 RepID=A0A0A3HXY9_9BACL|nr:ABC transporter substrate-binding protein [Ureibacillus sinduriensis]KGR76105.1 ABC transporter substrate-binding protein [Ureibacillus sinduriensis BLB-1 = JCM 15800]